MVRVVCEGSDDRVVLGGVEEDDGEVDGFSASDEVGADVGEGDGEVGDGGLAVGELVRLVSLELPPDSEGADWPPVPRGAFCRRCRPRALSTGATAAAAKDAATSISKSQRNLLQGEDMLIECAAEA